MSMDATSMSGLFGVSCTAHAGKRGRLPMSVPCPPHSVLCTLRCAVLSVWARMPCHPVCCGRAQTAGFGHRPAL